VTRADDLRAAGVAVGVTLTGPRQADAAELAVEIGAFDTVQATWNLLERSAGSALARAHSAGLGIIVKEALANGRLTADGGPERLATAARELSTTPDALAIAAALAQPWADVVLSGAATPAQLESNLAADAVRYDHAVEARLAGLAEDTEAYWARRSALPWI
jgi:aryl-alcohol dehydrogenase-like predicted oxidoreductase